MIIRSLDASGDWTFGKGIQNYASGKEALKVNLMTRIKEWKNDCFFSLQSGIDWNSYLDVGTKKYLDSDLLRVILMSFGVLRVDYYTSKILNRNLTFSAAVATVYGDLILTEVTNA